MELNVQEWKEFLLSKIFIMTRGTRLTTYDRIKGEMPLVTAGEENSGVSEYISNTQQEKFYNTLTIDMFNNCFYHSGVFCADDNILVLNNNDISIHSKLFISTVINQDKYRYSYGRQYRQKNYIEHFIKLPVLHESNGTPFIDENKTYSDEGYVPDWQFMEDYIKSLHHKPITTKIRSGNVQSLDVDKWEEFTISALFTLLNGKGITKEEIEENSGSLIAVQSGEENNGVLGKIDKQYCIKMGYTLTDKMCLTVARTGSAGFVSFQSEGCVVGDSAKILLLNDKIATKPIYLFLQTILSANRFKYDYGRKVTEDKYLSDIIKLPIQRDIYGTPIIDSNRTYSDKGFIPDWEFMEDYINSLPYSDKI